MDQFSHHSFVQANLNHCAQAQDLLMQALAQCRIDVAVAAEPYYRPSSHSLVGLRTSTAPLPLYVDPAAAAPRKVVREWVVAAGLTYSTLQAWRVLSEVETLLDHKYVRFEVSTSHNRCAPRYAASQFPR